MRDAEARAVVERAFERLEGAHLADAWSGVDAVLPLLERMRREGAVVLLKLDGERDVRPYTVVASRPDSEHDTFRLDTSTLDEGLAQVIAWYGVRFWGL